MTNEEKANALAKDYLLGHDRANITYEEMLGACLDISEWKDAQFKEYLEKKKEHLYKKWGILEGAEVSTLNMIINDLFNKS